MPTTMEPRARSKTKSSAKHVHETPKLTEFCHCEHDEGNRLLGILEEFEAETIEEAWHAIADGAPCHLKTKGQVDPGKRLKPGEDGCVGIDAMSAMERLINPHVNLIPVHFLEEGAIVQKAVARIALKQAHAGLPAGSGWATGFLVSPSLLLTNNHVIGSEAFASKVSAQFNYQNDYMGNAMQIDEYTFDPDDVFHTNATLDFTLIRVQSKIAFMKMPVMNTLRRPFREARGNGHAQAAQEYTPNPDGPTPYPPIPDFGMMRYRMDDDVLRHVFDYGSFFNSLRRSPGTTWGVIKLPANGPTYADDQHLNIIQHPQGRRKEVAVQDNHIDGVFTNVIHYETDTEPGSSGSPVFNNQWDVISLHHAGGERDDDGNWLNNEGIRLDKIVADLKSHYQGTATGNAILNELGI